MRGLDRLRPTPAESDAPVVLRVPSLAGVDVTSAIPERARIGYMTGQTAVTWAYLLASRADLLAARDDLDDMEPEFVQEHLARRGARRYTAHDPAP